MLFNIIACALAILASGSAVLALHISRSTTRRLTSTAQSLATCSQRLTACENSLTAISEAIPTIDAEEVGRTAGEAAAEAARSELGKMWAKFGQTGGNVARRAVPPHPVDGGFH